MPDFSKRATVTPTRAGMVAREFWLCWDCSAELDTEEETKSHACPNADFYACVTCGESMNGPDFNPFQRECETCETL